MIIELKSLKTQNLETIDEYMPADFESFEVKIDACIGSNHSEGGGSISGKDWSEISLKLSRFGYWQI